MRKQIYQDQFFSEQSSDIKPSQASNSSDKFKPSKEMLQSFSSSYLYQNLSTQLLQQPQIDQSKQKYGYGNQYTIFDSVVVQKIQKQQEIDILRQNKILKAQIQNLEKVKQQKKQILIYLKSRYRADQNIHTQNQKIMNIINKNKKTITLKQHLNTQWTTDSKQLEKRQQSVTIIENNLQSSLNNLNTKISDLQTKRQNLTTRKNQLDQQYEAINNKIQSKRFNRKQELINLRLQKQKYQIEKLKQSISKLKQIQNKYNKYK